MRIIASSTNTTTNIFYHSGYVSVALPWWARLVPPTFRTANTQKKKKKEGPK